MMMMVFWPHIYNCLAYMASLAEEYFWSNVLNRSLLIAEGGTYAKTIYVEKTIPCYVFQKWSKKFMLSRNQKHHKKRLKKTLVVMFSDFWLLTIFKSPLKNITNNIFFCAHNFEHNMDFYIVLTMFRFICLVQHSNIPSKQKKYYQTIMEKRMFRQIWRFQLRNTLKLSHKKKRNFNQSTHYFSKLRCFLKRFDVVFHMFMGIKKTFNQN